MAKEYMTLEIEKLALCGGSLDNLCCLLHATLTENRIGEEDSE